MSGEPRISYSRGSLGERMRDGAWGEAHVGALLRAVGARHEMTATGILRPAGANPKDYADIDCRVWDRDGIERLISIKTSSERFTGPADFPYPDCLLMSIQGGQDPAAYWATVRVSVNDASRFGIVVAPHWRMFERMQNDHERGGSYRVACVLREDLRSWGAFAAALAREAVSA